jgi:hypothetical protein
VSIEKLKIENHQELEDIITKEMSQIEKDLTMICNHIPINDKATLDVLCHDENGQLVIVQMNVDEDDTMLLHGIQSLDYVDKFKSFLKATYNKHKIDDKEKPRLIMVAPSFSDAVRRAVESMKGIRVDLYEFEYLKLGDHKGLRLQPIFASTSHIIPPTVHPQEEEKQPEKKREPKQAKKKEPMPEPEPEQIVEHKEEELKPTETPETQEQQPAIEKPTEQPQQFRPNREESKKKPRWF